MDVAFEKQNWAIAGAAALGEADCAHPEWFVLRARLGAARQTLQTLREVDRPVAGRRYGSFHRGTARQLAVLKRHLVGVNQKVSGNRNHGRHTYGAVADLSSAGGRG